MTDPASPREEFDRTVTVSLALLMSFAYESAKSYSLDPTADVIGYFTLDALMLALRHWLPRHSAWWLLGGFGAVPGGEAEALRTAPFGRDSWFMIGADLTSRLLPTHFLPGRLTWLD